MLPSSPPSSPPSTGPSSTQETIDQSRYTTTFSLEAIKTIKDAKRQIQAIIRSITSVEPEKIRDNLTLLSSICDATVSCLEQLNSLETYNQIPSIYVAMQIKNLRNGMSTLLHSRHESAPQIMRRIFSNFHLLAFLMSIGEVSVKIAVESMLRAFFTSLTICHHKELESFALHCLKDIPDPLLRCKFLLFMLQDLKTNFAGPRENKALAEKIIGSVPTNDDEAKKLTDTARILLGNQSSKGFVDLKRSASVDSARSQGLKRDRVKRGGPKIAIHDCRLESARVRNQKSNKLQLEILVVLDMQCANCDLTSERVGACIAHQTGLFVKEAVLRSKDMRMPMLDTVCPTRKRFEAEASNSRKRNREESSTDDDCDDREVYAPSPTTRSRSRLQDSDLFPPSVPSSGDAGAHMRCELAGIKTKSPQRLAPPVVGGLRKFDDGGESTHRFEATQSWLSMELGENSDTHHAARDRISPVLTSRTSDPLDDHDDEAGGPSNVEEGVRSGVESDVLHSEFLTEASSIPFVSPVFPTPSASPTESCSEGGHSHETSSRQAQSSSLGGGVLSRTDDDAASRCSTSADQEKTSDLVLRTESKMCSMRPPQKSHDLDEDEDEEVVSPNSRTLLHPMSRIPTQVRSTSPSSRKSDSSIIRDAVTGERKRAQLRYSHTYTDRRTSPCPVMCSQSTSQSSRVDLRSTARVPDRNTLTALSTSIKPSSLMEIAKSPSSFISRRSFLSPTPSKQSRRNLNLDTSSPPTSPSPTFSSRVAQSPSSTRRQSTVSYASREPLVRRQRSRASATSPMSSSMLSSSPSLKTPRETEILTPFTVMTSHTLGLIATCLGDCTNLGTSRKSSAVKQRNMDAAVAPLSADVLREELESHDPADPLVLGLIQAKARGGIWLVHHHILQALRRISFFHPEALEQYNQLSSLYLLLAKSMECLRSSISRKALEVTKDFYTPANATRRRVLDTGVAYMLPACLKKASDQSNLFLAEAAVNAYEAIVQNASEAICMSTLKPLINTAISSGQRWHIFRATSLVATRLQGRVATVTDIDKVITFAVKGLRDASSDSRGEARNLCNSLTKCLEVASPTVVNRLRTKVKPEDWARLTEKY